MYDWDDFLRRLAKATQYEMENRDDIDGINQTWQDTMKSIYDKQDDDAKEGK